MRLYHAVHGEQEGAVKILAPLVDDSTSTLVICSAGVAGRTRRE